MIKNKKLRYIINPFPDFQKNLFNYQETQNKILVELNEKIKLFYKHVDCKIPLAICSKNSKTEKDYSIYDGAGGNLYLYLELFDFSRKIKKIPDLNSKIGIYWSKEDLEKYLNEIKYLKEAEICFWSLNELIKEERKKPNKIRISFFFGQIGIYTLGNKLFYELNDEKNFKLCVNEILNTYKIVIQSSNEKYYDELLYGRSGLLYCLLYLQNNFGCEKLVSDKKYNLNLSEFIFEITKIIIENGVNNYKEKEKIRLNLNDDLLILPENFRLIYYFHEKEYLGGAHGFFGILYIILSSYNMNSEFFLSQDKSFTEKMLTYLEKSTSYYIKKQFDSGNFPSSNTNDNDKLFQFCHGSPGVINGLLLILEIFKKEEFKYSVLKAGDSIWQYGILKKGFGLCHGISGNSYGFLSLFKYFRNEKYLYQSIKFALCSLEKNIHREIDEYDCEDRFVIGKSDFPFSLMLGIAGDIKLLCDLILPLESKFPGFEI